MNGTPDSTSAEEASASQHPIKSFTWLDGMSKLSRLAKVEAYMGQSANMSLIVAVVGTRGVGLATDSIFVEDPDDKRIVHSGRKKVVRFGNRIAGISGVSMAAGRWFVPILRAALVASARIDEVPDQFQRLGTPVLEEGARRYVAMTGGRHTPGSFLQLFYAERSGPDTVSAFVADVDVDGARSLQFNSLAIAPFLGEAHVVLLGSVDEETFRHATIYRTIRRNRIITGRQPPAVEVPEPIPDDLPLEELGLVARRLAEHAVRREAHIQRAPWFPSDMPVLVEPVFGYTL